jgi:hypothetical protein
VLKYSFVYCSQINHGIENVFQYPGMKPPTNINVQSFMVAMLVVGHTSFWIYLINEVHLLQGSAKLSG